jgi:carboxylate-amine ligase
LQKKFEAPRLHAILQAGVVGQQAKVEDAEYLGMFGCSNAAISYGDLWQEIYGRLAGHDELALAPWRTEIEHILTHGNLASRIQQAMGPEPTHQSIQTVYHRLADCLLENRFF